MVLSPKVKKIEAENDTFFAVCGVSCVFTLLAAVISRRYFLPSTLISIAYAACVMLVPLAYRALGRIWIRFCNLLISTNCSSSIRTSDSKARHTFWGWFIALQLVLVITFWSVSVASAKGCFSETVSLMVSAGCFNALCVAVLVTHGVGGKLKHARYEFYQPFQGGFVFCVLQGFGWLLFAVSILAILLHFMVTSAHLFEFCGTCLLQANMGPSSILVGASSTGVIAEILLACSLLVFHDDDIPKKTLKTIRRVLSSPSLKSLVNKASVTRRVAKRVGLMPIKSMAETNVFLRRSTSTPGLVSLAKDMSIPKIIPEQKQKQPRNTKRTLELWSSPLDEFIGGAEPAVRSNRRIRSLNNWSVDVPLEAGFSLPSLQNSMRMLAFIPIVVASFHGMSASVGTATAVYLLPTFSVIVALSTVMFGSLLILDRKGETADKPKPSRCRRNRLNSWDYLHGSDVVVESVEENNQKVVKKGLQLFDTMQEVQDDSTPQPIKGRHAKGIALYGIEAIEDMCSNGGVNSPLNEKRGRSKLQLWDSLGPVSDDLPLCTERATTNRGKLELWNPMQDLKGPGRLATRDEQPSVSAERLHRAPAKSRLSAWDHLEEVVDEAPSFRNAKPSRARRSLQNWDFMSDVPECDPGVSSPRKDCTGKLGMWDFMESVSDWSSPGMCSSQKLHGTKRGWANYDFLSDFSEQELRATMQLKKKTKKRSLSLWSQVDEEEVSTPKVLQRRHSMKGISCWEVYGN